MYSRFPLGLDGKAYVCVYVGKDWLVAPMVLTYSTLCTNLDTNPTLSETAERTLIALATPITYLTSLVHSCKTN